MTIEITKELSQSVNNRVMYYFYEISKIPRGSGREQRIADYLVDFANKHQLEIKRSTAIIEDKQTHNVVIKKPASKGYETFNTVILQSHIDMVCQKTPNSKHNFDNDPIEVIKTPDDKYLIAKDTTLGADDGIGVACMLAILENKTIIHPPIEALFTSDEEDGMTGAQAITKESMLISGKRLINIDTETEGTLYYGCAGGIDANFTLPITNTHIPKNYTFIQIELVGLLGGHSGVEINKKRANAHKLMARTLNTIWNNYQDALLVSFTGGDKRNVITREATTLIAVEKINKDKIINLVEEQKTIFLHEYENIEDPKTFNLTATPKLVLDAQQALTRESSEKLIALILIIPNDVQAMHGKVDGLVETSCNLGIVRQELNYFYLCSLIRSFYETKKMHVLEQMRQLALRISANFSSSGNYPNWEPNPDSELVARFKYAYESAFPGSKTKDLPHIESIHAGLECGYFSNKYPDIDMIACGPTITGAHTTEEKLDITSTEKVITLLLTALNQMNTSP
ncbi:MAG: beta-Ala-His dipeptidase [Nitrososphaerota archaeon]|jgi:dipeptidase D|nr:beta-Ala-His dipeptidase [Nitrososphaerota archaeon]